MNKITYEHYFRGETTEFDKDLVTPIVNLGSGFTKPRGGFWASRTDAEFGWKQWCEAENEPWTPGVPFIFTLTNDAKVLSIRSKDDLEKIEKYRDTDKFALPAIDFEAMAKDYDAMEVDGSALCWEFYGWDCDSIVIFNADVIEEEKKDE
jgi:hypothetical protein